MENKFIFFLCMYFSWNQASYASPVFSVLDNGAKGDGATNDAQAFLNTWNLACKTQNGVMLVPSSRTFLIQPLTFQGASCASQVTVQVDGRIVAPTKPYYVLETEEVEEEDYVYTEGNGGINYRQWILFDRLSKGLTIKGTGTLDGNGASWWGSESSPRPQALFISNSVNVTVTGITIQNSPMMHLFVSNTQWLYVYGLTVKAPGDSPNTDAIHISHVQHAVIHSSTLACGDDCISIQTGCSDVKIHDVDCGPGHGYSIGGLGPPSNPEAYVSDISVYNSKVHDSQNGVRIKTWSGGKGSVKNVEFRSIRMTDVKNPIVIDQNYCGGPKNCSVTSKNAIAVSGITYTDINATYSYRPVYLICSDFVPCTDLTFNDIYITPAPAPKNVLSLNPPLCKNAQGQYTQTVVPSLKECLLPKRVLC